MGTGLGSEVGDAVGSAVVGAGVVGAVVGAGVGAVVGAGVGSGVGFGVVVGALVVIGFWTLSVVVRLSDGLSEGTVRELVPALLVSVRCVVSDLVPELLTEAGLD